MDKLREALEAWKIFDSSKGIVRKIYRREAQKKTREALAAQQQDMGWRERVGMAKVAMMIYEQSEDTVWLSKGQTVIEAIAGAMGLEGDDNELRAQFEALTAAPRQGDGTQEGDRV